MQCYRPDIEGEADLVEEILRIYGYDKIEPQSVIKDSKVKKEVLNDSLKAFYKSKRIIASRGYLETVTWSFVSSEQANIENKKDFIRLDKKRRSGCDYHDRRNWFNRTRYNAGGYKGNYRKGNSWFW